MFQTFLPKISSIPAQTIPLAVLAGVGFISSDKGQRKQQPENVKFFIVLLFSAMPCGLALISFVIKLYFPIKTRRAVGQIGEGAPALPDHARARTDCPRSRLVASRRGRRHPASAARCCFWLRAALPPLRCCYGRRDATVLAGS